MGYTYSEITDQYGAMDKTCAYMRSAGEKIRQFRRARPFETILYIGCGSSYSISQSLAWVTNIRTGLRAMAVPAGDLMLHHEHYQKLYPGAVIFAVFRSGATTELIRAIESVKDRADVPVISIVCAQGSALEALSDFTAVLPWAFDRSVCQTRTVSNMLAAAPGCIGVWAEDDAIAASPRDLISGGQAYLERIEPALIGISGEAFDNAVVLGDGEISGVAAEAALAYKEISHIPSVFYHLLDVRHGPVVTMNSGTLVVAGVTRECPEYQRDLIRDIAKIAGTVVVYSDTETAPIEGAKLHVSFGRELDTAVSGLPFLLISQLISYHKAVRRNIDPDRPDGLSAWIELS